MLFPFLLNFDAEDLKAELSPQQSHVYAENFLPMDHSRNKWNRLSGIGRVRTMRKPQTTVSRFYGENSSENMIELHLGNMWVCNIFFPRPDWGSVCTRLGKTHSRFLHTSKFFGKYWLIFGNLSLSSEKVFEVIRIIFRN